MTSYKGILSTDNEEQGTAWTSATGALTIPKQLFQTLIGAQKRNMLWRPLAAFSVGPSGIPGSSIDIDMEVEEHTGIDMAHVAEGAEAPDMVLQLETYNVKPIKYMLRLPITVEMMEDGKFDLMARSFSIAGYKAAKKQDSLIIDQVDADAANTTTGGATMTVANITRGMQYLEDEAYNPTDFIVGTEVVNDIRNNSLFVQADQSGVSNPSQSLIGRIFGMRVWVCNNFGRGNASNKKYAYIIDKAHAFMYAEKRPVTVKNFDQIWKDVKNGVVSMRFAAESHRANAIFKLTTT